MIHNHHHTHTIFTHEEVYDYEANSPIIAIHLTRPPIVIPDRVKLDIDHYKNSAKGAYIIKNYDNKKPKEGVVIIRGTSPINCSIKGVNGQNYLVGGEFLMFPEIAKMIGKLLDRRTLLAALPISSMYFNVPYEIVKSKFTKKAGFKSTQDYTDVVARYGSEDNYKKGKGLGT